MWCVFFFGTCSHLCCYFNLYVFVNTLRIVVPSYVQIFKLPLACCCFALTCMLLFLFPFTCRCSCSCFCLPMVILFYTWPFFICCCSLLDIIPYCYSPLVVVFHPLFFCRCYFHCYSHLRSITPYLCFPRWYSFPPLSIL